MPHWRVIEATGSSAERRITQLGHSPIAGETQDNGAIEKASSTWADTGLAQGARPLLQRTGPASSATAYKDEPDAMLTFFSPADSSCSSPLVYLFGKGYLQLLQYGSYQENDF